MSKVLSQEEVEALINNLPQEDDESVKKSYKKYDFKEKRSLNFDFEKLDNFADKFCEDLKRKLHFYCKKLRNGNVTKSMGYKKGVVQNYKMVFEVLEKTCIKLQNRVFVNKRV